MRYLIDTDIMVDFTRGNLRALDYLEELGDNCAVSEISALELIAGARTQEEVSDLEIMVSIYPAIAPTEEITRQARYLMRTHAKSRGLHTLDSLIAATALNNGLTLATKNRKHYDMIDSLKLDIPEY